MTVWLVTQGVAFAAWIFVAFQALCRLFGVMQQRSGQSVPGFRTSLEAPLVFWRDERFRRERRLLFWLTVILVALSARFASRG